MNTFQISSFQLSESKKWVPAGVLFRDNNGTRNIQEVEFPSEYRFNTKEDADNFFRDYYFKEGFIEAGLK